MTDPNLERSEEDDDDRTTVVDRSAQSSGDDGNETIVVDRGAPAADDGHDGTIVVDRSARPAEDDAHDGTVVVDRSAPADDHDGTLVVDRSAPADAHDGTVVVARPASEKSKSASRPAPTSRRDRRRITLPPVEPGFGPDAVDAVGAGAVDSYIPRTIEPAPAAAPAIPLGEDATRAPAPSMPSVQRRSRVFGAVAVGGFALACVISIVGLTAIVVSLLA